jgi:hypothetical protein
MKKNKYEISLWEDRLVLQTGEGQSIVPEHYEEEKVCIIGSDTMTSQARALEPKLVRNVNGTNKLTFKLYYTYIDNETGKRIQNPFTSLLVNERKVKCKWEDQWYDFVIKGIQEDSNGKTITYTCEDLYINELSKTGFSLEFDQKLNNNQGTAQELAKKVLEGTDWIVDTDNSDHILQTIEEPLYRATLTQNLDAKDKNGAIKTILGGSVIYLFYSVVQEKKSYIQFIYNTSYETESNSQLLKENNCYSVEMDWSVFETLLDRNMGIVFSDYRGKRLVRKQLQEFNNALNRNCYVYKDQSNNKVLGYSTVEYKDPTVVLNLISNSKEFVDTNGWQGALSWELYPLFFGEEKLNYSYTSTTYLRNTAKDPILVFNSGLQDSAGYLEDGLQPGQRYFLRIRGYNSEPKADENKKLPILDENSGIEFHIYDYFTALSSENSIPVHNTEDYCEKIGEPQLEDYYFITSDVEKNIHKNYYIRNTETKQYDPKDFPDGAVFPGNEPLYEKGQILQIEFEVIRARPKKEITAGYFGKHTYTDSNGNSQTETSIARPGIFISLPANSWIQEVQFYQRVEGYNGSVIHLGDFDTQSIGTTYYKYFLPNDNYKKEEDIAYLYCGITQKTDLTEVYEDKSEDTTHVLYEKIRSITAKNSNRFNILQNIAETFQCWVRFKIEHDKNTGKIIYENGIPKKTVYFKEEVGEDLGYGFVYGIDLKTISRSIDSNQLTTKVVVAPNTSEYAENGICRIADADLNENGENYILDFGYYISQGLLNSGELNKYLYLPDNNGKSGFYVELKKKNKEYNEIIEKLTPKKTELSKQTSLQTIYDQYVSNSVTEITTLQNNLCKLVGFDNFDDEAILEYLKTHSDNEEVKNIYSNLITQQHKRESFQASLKLIEASVNELTKVVNSYEEDLEAKANEKKVLENAFYQKFSRFIQEGSWTSQDYIDPNLYYLDARSVAYTSSRPKISYNISVIRLNALDEYKGKKFNVGDISFIEDKEFFGYIKGEDAWKTPYHEKVLISESTSWFDSPEKDTFTIQNYKTQFEDLFQRITATTQSLQYSTGEYNRASSIVEGKGVINTETLQNSININNELVFKSQNEEIFQDSTGLTLTDKRDPSKRTKLTSGGLFISTDGGVTWKNAVRGEGVATQYLTSGSINTNNIAIYDGAHASFRWDKYGINAYDATREIDEATNQEVLKGIITNNFVRFDQYGVYGIKGTADDPYNPQKEITVDGKTIVGEDKIWHDALFGMTWKGFFLKNRSADKNQQIEISTEKDICVSKTIKDEVVDKIRIGQITTKDNKVAYGLQLKDDTGATTMETDDSGQLWLRDKLRISDYIYELTSDTIPVSGKIYYEKNSDGIYKAIDITSIDSVVGYYELKNSGVAIGNLGSMGGEQDQVFNSNNSFIVYTDGSILARQGNFTGTINATNGSFSGEINATSGSIGGFKIANGGLSNENVVISPTGINILNDGTFSIFDGNTPVLLANQKKYKETSDTIAIAGKEYYEKDLNNNYTLITLNEGDKVPEGVYEQYTSSYFSGEIQATSGSFTGIINATDGIFKGLLEATKGSIGGFDILNDRLQSKDKKIVLISGEQEGSQGKIIAEDIELGNGAIVSDRISFKEKIMIPTEDTILIEGKTYYTYNRDTENYIVVKNPNQENIATYYEESPNLIANAYLQNPTLHNGVVLSAGKLKLRTSGLLEFGDIKISGDSDNPKIFSSLWSIDKEQAIFNNVIAQGGTIENVVFKNSTVQASGGIMIFKPSFNARYIESNNNDETVCEFELENYDGDIKLNVEDVILVNKEEGIITSVEGSKIFVTFSSEKIERKSFIGKTLSIIKLYNIENENDKIKDIKNKLLIGVNSNEVSGEVIAQDCHLFRGGLTVTAPIIKETESKLEIKYPDKPNLFIGDLSGIGEVGYGLYGDNVFLNGTLTTKVPNNGQSTYAGVNTVSGVSYTIGKHNDEEKIVFWAGATGKEDAQIQASPFQVTDKGNLYAKKGYFTDSVFSDSIIEGSTIRGADIYTANIHGWDLNGKQTGALNIYNTSAGIIFKTEAVKDKNGKITVNEQELFSIKDKGLIRKNLDQEIPILSVNTDTTDFIGNSLKAYSSISAREDDYTYYINGEISKFYRTSDSSFSSSTILLNKNSFEFILGDGDSNKKFKIEENLTTSSEDFKAEKNIYFNESLLYQKVISDSKEIGYDLYVKEVIGD